jgi:hypothetical protein
MALAREWKRLGRAATFVAVLTSPVTFTVLYRGADWSFLARCWARSPASSSSAG